MNILVIGSGGREHAICWKIAQSPLLEKLYCLPGNGGIQEVATCVTDVNQLDFPAVEKFCRDKNIGLVVIGPEEPLVKGAADYLTAKGIKVFGPSAKGAELEGSKAFTKKLCDGNNIPTAEYRTFTDANLAKEYISSKGTPIVIKADGLAAGKGVVVALTLQEALYAVDEIMGGKFGDAGATLVVEEFLKGTELSFFAVTDGDKAVYVGSAQDHKRAFDGDQGPNTGGMGTYAPSPLATKELEEVVMRTIIAPSISGLKKMGINYRGVLFAGLMLCEGGEIKLLEYNCRFGDPETQVLMRRMKSDIVPILLEAAEGNLKTTSVEIGSDAAVCVVMAAKGYPESYKKGSEIKKLSDAAKITNVQIFHAGTKEDAGKILASGGRVLGVTATGKTVKEARDNAYMAVDIIEWEDGFCRKDIALKAA
jgi:phosphoribosylamine--glycine ligase